MIGCGAPLRIRAVPGTQHFSAPDWCSATLHTSRWEMRSPENWNKRKRKMSPAVLRSGPYRFYFVSHDLHEPPWEKGHRIFHDLLGDNFNIDHVIISTKGIYVIETKTYSKPVKGESKISFDGEKLTINKLGFQTKPITQVKAATKWLKGILLESTGKEFYFKPVILFPGWYVESTDQGKKSEIWVLNPKVLPTYVENQRDRISKDDMMLASFHISRYIRTKEAVIEKPRP